MVQLSGIAHFQLAAPSGAEPAARAYFGELLGLTEMPKPEVMAHRGGVWFELSGGQQIHIGIESAFVPAKKAHPALTVDDIDTLAARLTAAGYEVRWSEEIPGTRRFHTEDPWGNRLEFWAAG